MKSSISLVILCPGMFISTILYIHVIYGCYFLATIQTNRTFLSLKAGQPNLLVVPPEQVLKAALSLYMVDKDLPMPTLEEMLICNHQTTSEEVYITDCSNILCSYILVCMNFLSRSICYGKGLYLIQSSRGYSAWYMLKN